MSNIQTNESAILAQDKLLSKHGRHSYEIMENASSSDKDLSKMLFNNCCVRHWQFNNCNLDNSDFQGTEFEYCEFINTSFNAADITSCYFKNCIFINCKFSSTNLLDTNIINSAFNNSEISTATFNNNIWDHCIFEKFHPVDTSIFANDYLKCRFINSELLTAIYYTIFDRCIFEATEIDSYILGFQFGLNVNHLKKIKIEHFGEKNMALNRSLFLMDKVYEDRRMLLEKEILNLIKQRQVGVAIESLIELLIAHVNNRWKIKVDEIRFIRRIINYLYKNNKIQVFYYYYIINHIENLSSNYCRKTLSENLYNELMLLCHTLYSIKMDIETEYRNISMLLHNNEEQLTKMEIEFIYKNKPNLRISDIICTSSNYNDTCLPKYESYGSFHEIYEITKEVLNNFAAIVTVIGGVFGAGKKIKEWFKSRRNKKIKSKNRTSTDMFNQLESSTYEYKELIVSEETKTITKTTTTSLDQDKILHQTVETIEHNRTTIIQDYDISNIKKIIVK